MHITRRQFNLSLATGTAALATGVVPHRAFAATELALGDRRVLTLSDGHLTLPGDFITAPMPQDEVSALRASHGIDEGALTPPCNVTLMQDGERTVLFDCGAGTAFQDSAGYLLDALESVGTAPEDITHVVFTHAHPDHLWGVLDDFDDPLFPEAEHMMGQAEFDYWMSPTTVDTIGEARASFAVGAARRLESIAERLTLFADETEILPGVAARVTPGHTPGHMAFELRGGSESVMVVGDAIGNHWVAFERPEWPSGSDQDMELAAETRLKLLDDVASAQMPVIGYHLPDGGLGYAERSGDRYRFVPASGG